MLFFVHENSTKKISILVLVIVAVVIVVYYLYLPIKSCCTAKGEAYTFLESMQKDLNLTDSIEPFTLLKNTNGYRINFTSSVSQIDSYLSSKLTKPNTGEYTSERGSGYVNDNIICWTVGSGASSMSSSYVWCGDKFVSDTKSLNNKLENYELIGNHGKVTLKYPKGFNAEGTTGIDGEAVQIAIKNFNWQKDAFSFFFIKSLDSGKFYMQIWNYGKEKSVSLEDWLKKQLEVGYNSPEKIQIVGEYEDMYGGELVKQTNLAVDGKPAIQRRVLYRGVQKNIEIVYTYVDEGNQVFQFISHSSESSMLQIYNQIVMSFRFVK